MTNFQADVETICALASAKASQPGRTIIGIAGPPASGKSTLAEAVVETLNARNHTSVPIAALVPMDGYHLDNAVLNAKGLFARKGAPETFDAERFCDDVYRLKETLIELFVPRFDRNLDISIAGAVSIHPDTPIIVVEGNYLLLGSQPWASLSDVFDASVFVAPPRDVLRSRLLQRWIDHGLDADAALKRVTENDLPNAERILDESNVADLTFHQDDSAS